MHIVNVTLDLCSAAVCLLLFVPLLTRKSGKGRLRNWFLAMCATNFFMSLGDITNWTCEGFAQPWYPIVLCVGIFLFWICTSLMLLTFTGYVIEYLSIKVNVHRRFWYVVVGICTAHMLGIVLSLWNGMFFTITTENTYQRGNWFWLSQLLPFTVYVTNCFIFGFYRKVLKQKEFESLSSYIIIPLGAEAIQMFYYGVAPLCISITLSILIIYMNIQSEQEQRLEYRERELSEARVDIMLSQIQPHFLYNNLLAISMLCDENPKQAKDSILDFALYLRANMDSLKSKEPIPFEQELKHTQCYLNLEQQRYHKRFCVVWNIHIRNFTIPALTMQPIVENAVRYGAMSREQGGKVEITIDETEIAYVIIIQDNGMGFTFQEQIGIKRSHMGIKNVRERLTTMCNGTLTIESDDGIGTTAIISIPKEVII